MEKREKDRGQKDRGQKEWKCRTWEGRRQVRVGDREVRKVTRREKNRWVVKKREIPRERNRSKCKNGMLE